MQTTTTPYGPFAQHTLYHPEHRDRISLILERGAVLTALELDGHAVLEGFANPNEVNINPWSKNRLLYPFPNRLAGGTYHWEGTSYQFPVNDEGGNNALHGFSMDRPFELISSEEDMQSGRLICRYIYDGEETYYPFPFDLIVMYQLSAAHAFQLEMKLRNTGHQSLPVGLGWHPYFKLSKNIETLKLTTPALQMIGVDSQMIPTGKQYDYSIFQPGRKIGSEILDNCFELSADSSRAELTLSEGDLRLMYWQECGPQKFNYIQLFTPPHRKSLAIEPMSCNIDAFNNGDGLIRLEAGQEVSMSCGIKLTPHPSLLSPLS